MVLLLRRKKTTEVMRQMFCSVIKEFQFTTELEVDFEDGYIPTLDTRLKVCQDGSVNYNFYEKSVASKFTIRENAALSENSKTSSLAQEVVRRLLTTDEWVTNLDRKKVCEADKLTGRGQVGKVIEDFNEKMKRSGYNLTRRQEIVKAGILGYKRKMQRTILETGGYRHKIGEDELVSRKLRKMCNKSS